MILSAQSLEWFRILDQKVRAYGSENRTNWESFDFVDAANQLNDMARATPAWIESYATIRTQLNERRPTDVATPESKAFESLSSLAQGATCPQVVDIDFPALALRRAEWINESLHLKLDHLHEQHGRFTTFRIVGVEPRLWYLTGINGTTMDVTAKATTVTVPLINGDLEITPGSY